LILPERRVCGSLIKYIISKHFSREAALHYLANPRNTVVLIGK
jgi:hypothetical protein